MQKSVEIIEFGHAKTGSRWSYMGDAADRVRVDWVCSLSEIKNRYGLKFATAAVALIVVGIVIVGLIVPVVVV